MIPIQFNIFVGAKDQFSASFWTTKSPVGVVIIHPATGVTQGYYEPFAHYLVSVGFSVITYDYRGIGRSRPKNLSALGVSMSDWMDEDVPAITQWAADRYPDLPLLAVGHSVGGHAIALSGQDSTLCAAVVIASHAGATHTIRSWPERVRVRLLLRVLAPIFCSIVGYMPGCLGTGADLPKDVALQWSRWTAMQNYFLDDPALNAERRMAEVRIPLLVLGFDDDPWANPTAIDMLWSRLPNAEIERRHFSARAIGLPAIGHMGFFRQRCEAALWRPVGDWLLSHCRHNKLSGISGSAVQAPAGRSAT